MSFRSLAVAYLKKVYPAVTTAQLRDTAAAAKLAGGFMATLSIFSVHERRYVESTAEISNAWANSRSLVVIMPAVNDGMRKKNTSMAAASFWLITMWYSS